MKEKNIFDYKLFLSLSILDFFLCKNCNPLKKVTPLSQHPPLKIENLLRPPPFFFENLAEGSMLPTEMGEVGAHYGHTAIA